MPFFSKFRQQILAFLGIPHDLFKKSHFVHFDDYMSAWQIPLTKGILNHILRARAFHDIAVTQKNSTPFEVICDNTWWKSFFINYSPFLATFDFHRYLRWEFFTASGRQFLRQKIWWTNFEKYYQQTGKNMTTIFPFCVKTKWHIYIYLSRYWRFDLFECYLEMVDSHTDRPSFWPLSLHDVMTSWQSLCHALLQRSHWRFANKCAEICPTKNE